MFNTQIDVAAIMREIKKNVVPEVVEVSNENEVDRIATFIQNTRQNTEAHIHIGYVLPQALGRPRIVRKMITFIFRVIRKLCRFITNDQIIVNKNTDACIKALVEREDAIILKQEREKELLEGRMQELAEKNNGLSALLATEKAKSAALESKLENLAERMETLEKKADCGISDELYLAFEEKFRGSTESIGARQDFYIDKYLKDKAFEAGSIAVDLGCGRGEWLRKLEELGMDAIGVDVNVAMVKECEENGLKAREKDAISFLQELEDDSVSVVSAFQVIEHLSKSDVAKLVEEAYRVLKPNGVLILETPNICNVEVGASAFRIDPTHINPVHPEYVKFLAETQGFSTAEIAYWKQEETERWLQSVMQQEEKDILDSVLFRTVFETIKQLIYSSPDYALVAMK